MSSRLLPASLRCQFVLVDVAFLAYWVVTAAKLIPTSWAFKDYDDPGVIAWNWSFLAIDAVLCSFGAASLIAEARGDAYGARGGAIATLALTHASGLMALAYWFLRGQFDLGWWIPNAYLMIYPWFYFNWARRWP